MTGAEYPVELESVVSFDERLGQLRVGVDERPTLCGVVAGEPGPAERL